MHFQPVAWVEATNDMNREGLIVEHRTIYQIPWKCVLKYMLEKMCQV